MKISDGIEVLKCSIEKVLKKYGNCFPKMCGNSGTQPKTLSRTV